MAISLGRLQYSIWNRLKPSGGGVWLIPLLAILPGFYLLVHEQLNLLSSLICLLPLLVLALMNVQASLYAILLFQFLLGDIRRIDGMVAGYPAQDFLLMIGPAMTLLISLPILYKLRLYDPISKAVFVVMVLMFLEVFNPRQGGLKIGLQGGFFELIPLLWFWIGWKYGTERVVSNLLFRLVLPLALVAALIGLYQTYVGFPPWQQEWVRQASQSYHSLLVGGFVRAFGFSVNAIEYVNLLLISSTAVLAMFFAGRRTYIIFFPLLGFALFLASSRQPILKLIVAVALAWSLRGKGGLATRLPLALGIAVGVLGLAVLHASGGQSGGGGNARASNAASAEAQHQVQGLADPAHSSAQGHLRYFTGGIIAGFKYPIGSGLGMIRGGSSSSGGASSTGDDTASLNTTEYDISDAFITMGAVGGIAYVVLVFLILRRGIRFGKEAPAVVALPLVSVVVAMIGSWVALGQYGMAPCMWFLIGALTRPRTKPVVLPAPAATAGAASVRAFGLPTDTGVHLA